MKISLTIAHVRRYSDARKEGTGIVLGGGSTTLTSQRRQMHHLQRGRGDGS